MRTVIYTQRVEIIEEYGERRDCADQRIADFISACGFVPIPVPNRKELAKEILLNLNPSGIILTGGNSLMCYGGNAPERDEMDKALIELSINYRIPLYGFCRGMQSILDYFGNELINVQGHVAVYHSIQEKSDHYKVNSYHQQACVKLKNNCDLSVLARSEDDVIEAICHESLPMIGTMWHPERERQLTVKDVNRVRRLFGMKNKEKV